MWKVLKRILMIFLILIVAFVVAVIGFINLAPQIGRAPAGEHLERISSSPNYGRSGFVNAIPTGMSIDSGGYGGLMREWWFSKVEKTPPVDLPTGFDVVNNGSDTTNTATWFGHSSILLEFEGVRILFDPVFGSAASPVPFFTRRFPYEQGIRPEDVPEADVVVISHDHYDHLDYPTMKILAKRDVKFIVPLGVGSHMQRWGITEDRITELDWWHSTEFKNITLHATPARHFSGRGLSDRQSTLWASWVIEGIEDNVYFSGDGGYSPFFKEIGDRFGPFQVCFVECGQYNYRWKQIHMSPEETVQAHIDLQGKILVPIHWGAFNLAPHAWTEPAERVTAEAEKQDVHLFTPLIGERFLLNSVRDTPRWWRELSKD